MRRFLFGVVIASVTAAMPAWAFGGDREIAQSVMTELKQQKSAGNLKGFDIDLKVEDGVVYLTGEVASATQRQIVTDAALQAVGRNELVNEIRVKGAELKQVVARKIQPVASNAVAPASTTERSSQPSQADMAITDTVIGRLQQSKAQGVLRGFELDVSTVGGDVWLRGKVANEGQKAHIIDVARRTRGVARVIDDISVTEGSAIRQVSTGALQPAASAPAPIPVSSMPMSGNMGGPQPMAPSGLAGYSGTPVPMNGGGVSYGNGAPRYDQPNMPGYAWPSYAAHPNYGAVTYPKQYSPSAWPYIGPFYPYPQVPLGWRKVALEWDDGLWYLDFTSK